MFKSQPLIDRVIETPRHGPSVASGQLSLQLCQRRVPLITRAVNSGATAGGGLKHPVV